MRNGKQTAIKLRLEGKSYSQITKVLSVPKSTLSGWLKDIVISKTAKEKIQERSYRLSTEALIKRNHLQTHIAQQKAQKIRKEYSSSIKKLNPQELLILGAGLYWAEGYKRPIIRNGKSRSYHPVSFSNSDPKLVNVFLKFLREVCKVEESKISANLRIYQHQNASSLLQFWSKSTKIPGERFHKFYYGVSKSSLGKRPFNILPYGTIQIRVNNTELYHRIMGWIEGLSKI